METQAEFVETERSLKEIEKDLRAGGSISTRDLRRARRHYKQLRDMLLELGDRWDLAFREANRLWMLCDSYLNARKKSL